MASLNLDFRLTTGQKTALIAASTGLKTLNDRIELSKLNNIPSDIKSKIIETSPTLKSLLSEAQRLVRLLGN